MTNKAAHLDRLPHQDPFRFISEIESVDPGRSAKGRWAISGKEDFFRGHFPSDPIVPGVLLGEALAQLSGIAVFGASHNLVIARLSHIDIKFVNTVRPPAEIELQTTLTRTLGDLSLFDVRATCSGRPVAHGSLMLSSGSEVP